MNIEYVILDFIQEHLSSPVMDVIMKFFTFLGNGGLLWISMGLILAIIPKTRKIGFTVCFALAFSAILCSGILKPMFHRARPFEGVDIELLISAPHDHSFPSGHTATSFAAAAAVFIYNQKFGLIAMFTALFIAFSRLYLYVHFPSDVLVGIYVGGFCAIMSYYFVNIIYRKLKDWVKKNKSKKEQALD